MRWYVHGRQRTFDALKPSLIMSPQDSTSPPQKLRLLVVDDHALVRAGVKRVINRQHDMEVVADAGDGEEAVRLTQSLLPTLVLVDFSMPGWNGVEVTREIKHICPQVKVIGVSRHREAGFAEAMIQAGASGYVLKQSGSEELLRAVRTVAGGSPYLDRALDIPATPPKDAGPLPCERDSFQRAPDLTLNEEQVLRLVAASHSREEIARELSLDGSTVMGLKARAMQKTGLSSRVDVVEYARARGWLPSPSA
jgi:two-component system, NarL family, response regulator NreC